MKRTILVGVMVLGTSICSQSFGFDLLDRMLGLKGSGCDSTCCDTVVCEPACGAETACSPCEPVCGAEIVCDSPCAAPRKGLLDKLFGGKSCCDAGCDVACEPACGAEVVDCCSAAPTCGCEVVTCKPKRAGLLSKLFGGLKCKSGCDTACDVMPGCTSCGSTPAPAMEAAPSEEAKPMPPAPVVDPTAFLNNKRRVIQASTYTR